MHANVPERRLRRRRQSTPRAVATPFRRSSSAGREAGERAKKKKIPITVVDGVYYTRVAVGVTTIAFKLKLFRSDSSNDGLPPPMKALQNALGPAYLASYARCAAICTPPNSYEMRAGHSSLWSGVLWRAATTKRGWTAPKQLYKMRLREMPFRKCCMESTSYAASWNTSSDAKECTYNNNVFAPFVVRKLPLGMVFGAVARRRRPPPCRYSSGEPMAYSVTPEQ